MLCGLITVIIPVVINSFALSVDAENHLKSGCSLVNLYACVSLDSTHAIQIKLYNCVPVSIYFHRGPEYNIDLQQLNHGKPDRILTLQPIPRRN
jgi:hypothetical protein